MEEVKNGSRMDRADDLVETEPKCRITRRKWVEDTEEMTIRLPAQKIRVMSTVAKMSGRTPEEIAQMFLLFGYRHMEMAWAEKE